MSDAATKRIMRARIQLMLHHPYLASATARLQFFMTDEHWCMTMATDGFNIFYRVSFVEKLDDGELMGVVAHEVMHCVLGHIDRRGDRVPEAWNIAIDIATNLMLTAVGITLPADALMDPSCRGMTAEDIYDQQEAREIQRKKFLELRGANQSSDQHLDPNGIYGGWARSKDFPTELERRRFRKSWASELQGKLPGTVSGEINEEIRKASAEQINWRAFLSNFVSGLRRDNYRMFPANKKHLWQGLYLPSFGAPGPDHIVVAVDTSGSMASELLAKILAEIDAARQIADCRLTIIQCDWVIKSVETFEGWDLANISFEKMKFRGRGGTSLVPPFEWINKYIMEGNAIPDALVYMTDGYGDFPKQAPGYPCLWVMPNGGNPKVPFGIRIALES